MKRDESEGMSTDFPSRWAPDEGLSASISESSQGEDVDEREMKEISLEAMR